MRTRISEAFSFRLPLLAVCLGLIGITWFVFGQTRTYPFINYDDPEYVYEVPEINHGLTAAGLVWAFTNAPSPDWSPLTNISHMLEAQFFGMDAGGYHLTNVILHAVAAVLLVLVLWQSTGALWRSAFVAVIFAIHPLRVESVAWVTERKDVLSGVFFMLTLGAYVTYARKPGLLRYLLVFVGLACGLMSKPMLVTTPVVLLLLDYWPLNRVQSSEVRSQKAEIQTLLRLIAEKIPLLALSALFCVRTVFTQVVAESSLVPPPLLSRIKNALVSLIIYIRESLWPVDLAVFYPHPHDHLNNWLVLISAALVIGITWIAISVRRRRPYVLVGWFWYLVMLSPVLGIVQAGRQGHADRFTYLPQIGLCLLGVWLVSDWTIGWWKRREILAVAGAVSVVALAWIARIQTGYWRDSELLWSHAIAVTRDNVFAHASLADLLLRRGRLDEAITHSKEALKLEPRDADAHNNLGLALLQKGDESEAVAQFQESLAIDPGHVNAAPNLAWILATSSNPSTRDGPKAVELAGEVAQRLGHPNAFVLRTLAAAYAESGRFTEAIDAAEQGFQLATAQGNSPLAEDLRHNIDNYRMGLPLRSNSSLNGRRAP
jgi:hypothetical protein